MYNRYIRNDRGVYTRIPEADASGNPPPRPPGESTAFSGVTKQQETEKKNSSPPPHSAPPPPPQLHNSFDDSISKTLRRMLDRFHLENVDTSDLLLLLLLFLLFKEDADEELLFALGLLLIL